jgi:CBS-domain-containing membrane protein
MPIYKLKGDPNQIPPRPSNKSILFAWLGSFLIIASLAFIDNVFSTVLILGSFGASCVLVFGYPAAPFSQPRNVIFGHLISSIIGLSILTLLGPHWWAMALAVSTTIAAMMILRIVHPPAGSNPIIIFLTAPTWDFILFPTLIGAICVIIFALIYNNIVHKNNYPLYW